MARKSYRVEKELSPKDFEEKIIRLESLLREAEDSAKKSRIEIDLIINSRTYRYGSLLRDKLRPFLPVIFVMLRFVNSFKKLFVRCNNYRKGILLSFLSTRVIRFLALSHLRKNGFRKNFVVIDKDDTSIELKKFHSTFHGIEDDDQFKFLTINNVSSSEFLQRNIALGLIAKRYSKSGKRKLPGKMKHVYIDCRAIEKKAFQERGIGEISRNLINEVTKHFKSSSISLIVNSLDSNFQHENLPRISIRQLKFINTTYEDSSYINLSPMTEESIDVAQFLLNPLVYKISLFYDLIPSHFPRRYLRGNERYLYKSRFLCLDFYDEIWCISKSVEMELKSHFPKKNILTRLPQQKFMVPDEKFQKNNTVVFIGGDDLRKNNWYAISSILKFCKNEDYFLIVLGLYDSRNRINFVFSRYRKYFRVENRVLESEKFTLIKSAKILVCASLDEGLSLPPIEGILSHTAVVASNIPVHEGSLGKGYWLFDPWKMQGLYKSLLQVSSNLKEVQISQKTTFLQDEVKNYFE
jgi:hypothetical protein